MFHYFVQVFSRYSVGSRTVCSSTFV